MKVDFKMIANMIRQEAKGLVEDDDIDAEQLQCMIDEHTAKLCNRQTCRLCDIDRKAASFVLLQRLGCRIQEPIV